MMAFVVALGVLALLIAGFLWAAVRLGAICDARTDEAIETARLEALAEELRRQDEADDRALAEQVDRVRGMLGDADGIITPPDFSPAAIAAGELTGRPPILEARHITWYFEQKGYLSTWGSGALEGGFRTKADANGFFQEVRITGPRPYWRLQTGWMSGTTAWQPIHPPKRFNTFEDMDCLLAQVGPTSCPPPRIAA